MSVILYHGDCLDVLKTLEDSSIDSVVTDPPYGLSDHSPEDITKCLTAWIAGKPYQHATAGFLGNTWDSFVPGPEIWKECLRVLKPGGHMLVFAGTRSMDLMSMAVRLSGFELRDSIGYAHEGGTAPLMAWNYGQGMPHGVNISKKIDKEANVKPTVVGYDKSRARPNRKYESGAIGNIGGNGNISDRTDNGATITAPSSEMAKKYEGWSTQLKPAWEPIIICRKPLEGTAASNTVKYGTGGMNIDACRLPINPEVDDPRLGGNGSWGTEAMAKNVYGDYEGQQVSSSEKGRFPSNVITDGSDIVEDTYITFGTKTSGKAGTRRKPHETHSMSGTLNLTNQPEVGYADSGSASRFFYQAKATAKDRLNSKHPTIKPNALMRYLVKLVTPKGGVVLDPFAGSGSTGEAATDEGFNAIIIEREEEYVNDCVNRLGFFLDGDVRKI